MEELIISGNVFWKHPDNSKTWGDIVCINQVGNETTFEFVITKTQPGGSAGGRLTMTVKDLGTLAMRSPMTNGRGIPASTVLATLPAYSF